MRNQDYTHTHLNKITSLLIIFTVFAIASTSLLILSSLGVFPTVTSTSTTSGSSNITLGSPVVVYALARQSLLLTIVSWSAVVGAFVWRGRVRSVWKNNGLGSDVFKLIVKMKGSQNRIQLLKELAIPKDRLQLAKDLSVDWDTVDYHVGVLLKHKLICERVAYGQVKVFELTSLGSTLLKVLEETSHNQSSG